MVKNLHILFVCLLCTLTGNAQTIGLLQNDSLAFNGYTLFAPNSSLHTYLIDNCGNLINSWQATNTPGLSAYLLEDGSLLRTTRLSSNFGSGGTGGRIERYSWDGALEWGYNHSSATYHQHHDIEPLPNGNLLIIAWEAHAQTEAIAFGRNPALVGGNGVWLEQIIEIEPVGTDSANVVWEWHLWDHLVQDFDDNKPNYGLIADHPERMNFNFLPGISPDWIHLNSIAYNPALDQIMLSSRSLSEIWIIDHSTTSAEAASHSGGLYGKGGDFLFRWGNPQTYDHGGFTDQQLYGQHHVTWIPEGYPNEGKILLFNNGVNRPGGSRSTVDILEPPVDVDGNYMYMPGQPYGPGDLFWTYGEPGQEFFYSPNISGALAMPNGNVLICDGSAGRFFEVGPAGDVYWDYINPVNSNGSLSQGSNPAGNAVFRALRYAPDYPAFVGRDLTPGDPVETNPLPSDCVIYDGTVTGISNVEPLSGVWLKNNLVGDYLFVENQTGETILLEIVDLAGRVIHHQKTELLSFSVNLSAQPAGMYFVRFSNINYTRFTTEKIVK